MARCGCNDSCNCLLSAGDGIDVSGSGTVVSPYTIATQISANADNVITIEPDGLYVPAPTVSVDGCLTGDGSAGSPLEIVISPAVGNALQCITVGDVGLFVPDSVNTVQVLSPCLTGDGTVATPIEIVISALAGNALTCQPDGLYAASGGGAATVVTDGCVTGDGSVGDPVRLLLDPAEGDTLECGAGGLRYNLRGGVWFNTQGLIASSTTPGTTNNGPWTNSVDSDASSVVTINGANEFVFGKTGFYYLKISARVEPNPPGAGGALSGILLYFPGPTGVQSFNQRGISEMQFAGAAPLENPINGFASHETNWSGIVYITAGTAYNAILQLVKVAGTAGPAYNYQVNRQVHVYYMGAET